jgi:hypothetical protein
VGLEVFVKWVCKARAKGQVMTVNAYFGLYHDWACEEQILRCEISEESSPATYIYIFNINFCINYIETA